MSRPLRVLDLGAHDGYVSAWLLARYEGELEIDALELMPEAAERARERGINCEVGAAEDAPEIFEPGTYDAVFAYELIEHVPDVDRLLSACERMLAPGGRIYLSTPNGTFGAGNNPHHLRALRAIDLGEILRARGRIEDMAVGPDGVTIASYKPAERRGKVAIYTGPSWMAWAPQDIETKGLGGSETAAVRLAEHLSCLGFVVTVYGEIQDDSGANGVMFKDVLFRHHTAFDPLERREAVIASRLPEIFDRPVAARRRILWTHDTDFGPRLTPARVEKIDRILVLSEWHRQHVAGMYPFAADKLEVTRNGIEHAYFRHPATACEGEREKRVLYTSSPDRGLDILLELWPQIRERVPDAKLAFTYAPVYFEVAKQRDDIAAHAEKIEELAKQEGVEAIGSLSQPRLVKLMRSSLVWAHPSWNTPNGVPFHETSCIGAMEAQAAGLCVVASGWGALCETVKVGRLVDSDPPGERWRNALIENIVEALTNEKLQAHAQTEGPKAVADLGWDGVGEQVVALIESQDHEPQLVSA